MSGQHTPGRLVVGELNGHCIEIKHSHGDVPGAISLVLARVTARPTWMAEAEANARRLAACWNACEGSETEDLERLGADFIAPLINLVNERDKLLVDSRAIEANYEAARVLLAEVLSTDDAALAELKSIGMTMGEMTSATSSTERIRAFLKGETPPYTIPAGWALNSADFSVIAGGGRAHGGVELVRTGEDRTNWHKHADADVVALYVLGRGATYNEALLAAIKLARAAAPVPKGGA